RTRDLIERLAEHRPVVNDDVAASLLQRRNSIGKVGPITLRRVEEQLCARCDLMDDFRHSAAFVLIISTKRVFQYGNGVCAGELVERQVAIRGINVRWIAGSKARECIEAV